MGVQRDRLGRRIGRNLWREHVWDNWHAADYTWWQHCENETSLYDAEVQEYRSNNPRPNLGDFMETLSPSWIPVNYQPEECAS